MKDGETLDKIEENIARFSVVVSEGQRVTMMVTFDGGFKSLMCV